MILCLSGNSEVVFCLLAFLPINHEGAAGRGAPDRKTTLVFVCLRQRWREAEHEIPHLAGDRHHPGVDGDVRGPVPFWAVSVSKQDAQVMYNALGGGGMQGYGGDRGCRLGASCGDPPCPLSPAFCFNLSDFRALSCPDHKPAPSRSPHMEDVSLTLH